MMRVQIFVTLSHISRFNFFLVCVQAEIAGLTYSLTASTRSLKLHLGGYSEKLSVLADAICQRLVRFEVRFQSRNNNAIDYRVGQKFAHTMISFFQKQGN